MARLTSKLGLLRGLLSREVAQTGPFDVALDVTRRCNLHCTGCRSHGPSVHTSSPGDQSVRDIPLDLARRLIAELKTAGTNRLSILGEGEPFLYAGLFDLIALAKEAGMRVEVLTNGTFLDKRAVEGLIVSGLDDLKVSLWATSASEYARNYPGTNPDMFDRVAEGVLLLVRRRLESGSRLPRITLHQPLNRHNFDGIDRMADFAHSLGCDKVSLSPLKTRRGNLNDERLTPEQEQVLLPTLLRLKARLHGWSISENIEETSRRYEIGERVWEKLPCYVGWLHARIKVDGTVLACNSCNIPMGNLHQNSFQDIWNGPTYRSFRRQTLSRSGLEALNADCDCGYCCHVRNNLEVHRYFNWLAPAVNWVQGAR